MSFFFAFLDSAVTSELCLCGKDKQANKLAATNELSLLEIMLLREEEEEEEEERPLIIVRNC